MRVTDRGGVTVCADAGGGTGRGSEDFGGKRAVRRVAVRDPRRRGVGDWRIGAGRGLFPEDARRSVDAGGCFGMGRL